MISRFGIESGKREWDDDFSISCPEKRAALKRTF
jgi:hypothetical protein